MLRILVLEYKVCSIDYFLDVMQPYELNALLENIEYSVKTSWEQTRFQSYVQAQSFSTKKMKMTDLITFGWDKEVTKDTSISNEDIERLKNKAQQIINNNNGRFSNKT